MLSLPITCNNLLSGLPVSGVLTLANELLLSDGNVQKHLMRPWGGVQRADFGATWLAFATLASPLTSLVNSGKFPDLSVADVLTYTISAYNIFQVFKTKSGRCA